MLAAFSLRLIWVLVVPVDPVSDGHVYDVLARSLAEGKGYAWPNGDVTAHWPVGMSFIISVIYRVFGYAYFPIAVLNVMVGTTVVWLSYVLARRLFDERVALCTGWLLAVWPILIQFSSIIASELYFLLFTLSAFVIWTSGSLSTSLRVFLTGIAIGAASYIRPTALLLPVLLVFFDIHAGRWSRRGILNAAAVVLVVVLTISPWSVRNTKLFGGFTSISTNFGPILWMGNNPDSDGTYMKLPPRDFRGEWERDKVFRAEALDYIKKEPAAFLSRAVSKVITTHSRETIGVHWNAPGLASIAPPGAVNGLKWLTTLYWWAVLSLAMGGVILLFRRSGVSAILNPALLVWGYHAAIPAVTLAQDRYHMPANPFIAMLASGFLIWLYSQYRERKPVPLDQDSA